MRYPQIYGCCTLRSQSRTSLDMKWDRNRFEIHFHRNSTTNTDRYKRSPNVCVGMALTQLHFLSRDQRLKPFCTRPPGLMWI